MKSICSGALFLYSLVTDPTIVENNISMYDLVDMKLGFMDSRLSIPFLKNRGQIELMSAFSYGSVATSVYGIARLCTLILLSPSAVVYNKAVWTKMWVSSPTE